MTSLVAMSQTAQEQRIIDLSKKKFQWMIAMNFDSLESVLDDRMVFIHSNGWPETKTEFINDIKSGKLRYKSIEVVEASARMYQGSAVIIGRGKFKVALVFFGERGHGCFSVGQIDPFVIADFTS